MAISEGKIKLKELISLYKNNAEELMSEFRKELERLDDVLIPFIFSCSPAIEEAANRVFKSHVVDSKNLPVPIRG